MLIIELKCNQKFVHTFPRHLFMEKILDFAKLCLQKLCKHRMFFEKVSCTLYPSSFAGMDFVDVLPVRSQCPRTNYDKRSLPRPTTTTAYKLVPHRSKITNNQNLPHWIG